MKNELRAIQESFESLLKTVKTVQDLENLRVATLGRNGSLTQLMKKLGDLSLEEKRELGPLLNSVKTEVGRKLLEKETSLKATLEQQQYQTLKSFDVTLYRKASYQGSLHIYSHVVAELEDIFISMGYQIADGPEVETDFYNFEALNVPKDHPARDMQDSFWLNIPGILLRTQTSNVQIHTMETQKPPIAIFAPGRVFRNEATDATHEFMFMQGECLFIDKKVSVGNLLATAQAFLQAFFNKKDLTIRVRPGYFPFVEPGLEIDASCPFCTKGCSLCKHTRWIELLGSGLVHPNVLRAGGIDPNIYSGFAFGFGIDRLAMIKYGIDDIRLFRSTKPAFLKQF
jgi:phenylalanyl-tRNA synthetase alpha chain